MSIEQLASDVLPAGDRVVGRIVQPIEGKLEILLEILEIVHVTSDSLFDRLCSGAVGPDGHAIDPPHELAGRFCRNPGHVSMLRSRITS